MSLTIITAVFNNQQFVADAINSVLNQTFQDFEYIIVDGASTDGTLEVLNIYRGRIDKLISEPDKGIYDALNKGIRYASGDYVGFLHSDDLLAHSDVLRVIHSRLTEESVDSVYGDLQYVSQREPQRIVRYWKAGDFSKAKLIRGWMPPHPTLFIKRAVYEKYGGFDTSYKIAADYDLILRLFGRVQITTQYISQVLVKMRIGGVSNRSIGNVLLKMKEDYMALKSNQIGGIGSLMQKNVGKVSQFWHR
jgi:glycosyltransferase